MTFFISFLSVGHIYLNYARKWVKQNYSNGITNDTRKENIVPTIHMKLPLPSRVPVHTTSLQAQ